MTRFTRDHCEFSWTWLAADVVGHLGLFTSANCGALLPSFQESIEDAEFVDDYVLDNLVEELGGFCEGFLEESNYEAIFWGLVCPGKTPAEARADCQTLLLAQASCGLFVYQSPAKPHYPEGYVRLACPAEPRPLDSFPPEIARIVDRYRFSRVQFASAETIHWEDVV